MQTKKERKPIYSILIEHREIPLLAVLARMLTAISSSANTAAKIFRIPAHLHV